MKFCLVKIRRDAYVVYIRHSPNMQRMYTDDTLPDELKEKLGLLLASKHKAIEDIGFQTTGINMYSIQITDKLYAQLIGEINDEYTRSQSKSQSQEVVGGV